MKSRTTIIAEGTLYFIIAAGGPLVELLISDRELTQRALTASSLMALVAGANALKAFLSQSMQASEPMEVTAPPGKPLPTIETKPKDKTK